MQKILDLLRGAEDDIRLRGGGGDDGQDEPYDPTAFEHDPLVEGAVSQFERDHGVSSPGGGDDVGTDDSDGGEPSPEDTAAWASLESHLDEPVVADARGTVRQLAFALYQLKVDGSIHDKVFDLLCHLIHRTLPDRNRFPRCATMTKLSGVGPSTFCQWSLAKAVHVCTMQPCDAMGAITFCADATRHPLA